MLTKVKSKGGEERVVFGAAVNENSDCLNILR